MMVMASSSTDRIIFWLILLSVALSIYMNPQDPWVRSASVAGQMIIGVVEVGALSTEAARPLHAKITCCRMVSIR
jgi:hypothetical protein